MDGDQPASDLKEHYRQAVLNLPIDVSHAFQTTRPAIDLLQNPTAYLREIKRLQGLMLDMEFEYLDHDQEPEKVRKDFKEAKKNTRELRLSPDCFRAVQGNENTAGEEPASKQSTFDELAVKEMTSGKPAVDMSAFNGAASPEHQIEEPIANQPAIAEPTTKKNKKKKKRKPASKNAPISEPTTNHPEIESDAEANALTNRITQIHHEALRPKNFTEPNSEEYKNELIQNIGNELLNVKCMVMSFMDTSDSFSARAMDEMTKLGERLANLKDGTKELMAVINELDQVRSRGLKCKREVRDVKEELVEVRLEFEDTKKELNETKNELAEVKEKNQVMEKKMNEMYAWYKKQKEVPLSHFH
ncbi:hypothetical protein KCU83_g7497, partial [Aureobasidium melanogenum]